MRQQQFEDVVALLAAGDRPEDTLGTIAVRRCRTPSAMVDFPVSPSGEAM
jgi:hypothetical protein